MTDTGNVEVCMGCKHLTEPDIHGNGFRCLHVDAQEVDYVNGGTFSPRAQKVRASGPCGPDGKLRERW